jgi:hypothetical protein
VGHWLRRLGILACLIGPSRVSAQLPPLGVPGGVLRIELDGSLESFGRQFRDGRRESYAADLSSPALGSDRIPSLADAESRIGRIIGNTGYRLNLGALSTDAEADVGTGSFGLSLGLTRQITVFGRIPLVRARVQSKLALDPTSADAGLSPDAVTQLPFFDEFDAALGTLSAKIAAGDYNGNPSTLALAQATLANGTALRSDLFGLLADPNTASPVLPTTTSGAGAATIAQVTGLQNTLATTLGVPGFALAPALPQQALADADLQQLLTNQLALRLGESSVTFRGDAEAGATLTLIDRWDRGTHRGGFRTAVSGLVRFPTGQLDRSDRPLDFGTGQGQTDLQVDLVTDLGGGKFGARLGGSYVRRLAATLQARVTSPSQPFVGPERLAIVRRDPGDIVAFQVLPFFRLARTLGLQAGLQFWSRGTDEVTYSSPADAIPGVDASVLADDSKANATVLSVGITYANPGGLRLGGTGLPIDASWSYERVLRAGGGRIPDTHAIRARFRAYFGLW